MENRLAARNEMVNWQVAPKQYEISNYDEPKLRYRKHVEQFINPLSLKSLRKKTFFTISTNVLCADISSSKDTIDPIDRDIYLPLEIAIVKWSLAEAKEPPESRELDAKAWMINPGPPTKGSNCYALEHKRSHKIDFDPNDQTQNTYIESDLSEVMKQINSFLSADRLVFSLTLKHVRQDLGSLKWLNRETGYRSKPIKVYSLQDLYVVMIRHFQPDLKSVIGYGMAEFRMEQSSDAYNSELQCSYHKAMSKNEGGECRFCAKGLSIGWTSVLVDDVAKFGIA